MKKPRIFHLLIFVLLLTLTGLNLCQPSLGAAAFLTSNVGSPYVSLTESPPGQYLVTVNFRPAGYTPYQKAVFYIYFNENPTGWLVNIGDSSTNNGWSGDGATQSNDSELQILNGSMAIYCSDYGSSQLLLTKTGCAPNFTPYYNCIRVEISNNKVSYYNYATGDEFIQTSPFIFALNGQADNEGPINYTIYAAFNRVVNGQSDRTGSGVTGVSLFLGPETTPMQVYYGYLHCHTGYSDGRVNPATGAKSTPANAFERASSAGLNFLGVADHSSYGGDASKGLDAAEWANTLSQARSYTVDGQFIALRGFEWTGDTYGHVAITGTADYCQAHGTVNTFDKLLTWLSTQRGIAVFNHPGRNNSTGLEFVHFTGQTKSDKFVGMECWNKNDNYWYSSGTTKNEGYVTGDGKNYFEEAIANGWYIGTAGAQDNHDWDWGAMNYYRTAVWARNLTAPDILEAFQARRIYATWDQNLVLSFKINGNEMGSKILAGNNYKVELSATDGNGEAFTSFEVYNNGQRLYTPISIANPYNLYITFYVNAAKGDRYYAIVTQADGNKAISSPIYVQ
ncbi:MAG: CehA/McbA family metallohydrolase [Firmicutes bacterium]|nr:CehA/McbA family metallohydrolase [Bacillota bacterium]